MWRSCAPERGTPRQRGSPCESQPAEALPGTYHRQGRPLIRGANRIFTAGKARQLTRVYAPQGGVVSALNVREGMYVKPATEVMTLADLSSVWLLAEVFERQAHWVQAGQPAEVRLSYAPGRQ